MGTRSPLRPRIVPLQAALAISAALGLAAGACRRPPPPSAGSPEPQAPSAEAAAPGALPDRIEGFVAGPTSELGGATRRSYRRGDLVIDVTLARFPMDAAGYERWVKSSVEGYPQAALPIPAAAGNGFYQCRPDRPALCDLLIQLRSGVHLELRAGGTARREDVDAVARGLPLGALAPASVPAAPAGAPALERHPPNQGR
jgi:hypothetical protein